MSASFALGLLSGASITTGANTASDRLLALRTAVANQDRGIVATAKRSDVQRDVQAFRDAVAKATDPEALLSNPRALKVLLTANGLADQIAYPGLARRALTSDLTDPKSLANKLSDSRWKATAGTYQFAAHGLAVLRQPEVLDTLADAYAEVMWRKGLDVATPGLSDALTFREQAKGVSTVYDVLGNGVLRRVVTTALGLPPEIALQTVEAQAKAVTDRLDISKLKEPRFVEAFTRRYLIASASTPGAFGSDLMALAARSRSLVV